ncbi:class I SAM-dependent methyltransferase [Phyllobacterium sp. 628]|uniref:class I SAM-dependent methyltransferase n=1 Tax=Phyllobacterium sp. 628 TaxID=2718938 RepID=UPI0016624C08|nr:class I SAM-dependent methyltransferase [Phyllobacterium sp. 628]QND53454.1 class I SAM-dependent methyltransferase [Phyllobacterium sp. 628]
MTYVWREYPTLTAEHVGNARLFANREDMVSSLSDLKDGKVIAEIGVAQGNFSEFLLQTLKPAEFVAFDLFTIHQWPSLWGKDPKEIFGDKTHPEWFKDRFAGQPVKIEIGKSWDLLPKYPDKYFDMIYLDGDHEYEGVKLDAALADKKIKDNGIIIFNDYIMYDHAGELGYGVVQVANQLIVEGGYEVIGFALERNMFCDLAVRKKR